jgi:rifampicin phosphotransferase
MLVKPPRRLSGEQATQLIENGQRVRVHGTDGYVEILTSG